MKKYKIAIIYDVSVVTSTGETIGWAYNLRARMLQKHAPHDFEIDIFAYKDVPWAKLGDYSLVFNLEYQAPSRSMIPAHVPLVISFNSDGNRRHQWWPNVKQQATYTIFNNQHAFDYYGRLKKTCCISNGIEPDLWHSETPISQRPHKILWSGSSNPKKGKGFSEVIQPLEKLAEQHGFETHFRPINDIDESIVFTYDKQREYYNSGSYVLCASSSEGTPGTSLEGMACGCVLVTTAVGNVLEYGRHGTNCMIADRTPESFLQALLYAREHRERLSAAGMKAMHDGWSYGEPGNRAQYFMQLFRRIIDDGPESIEPFSFLEKHWSEI